MSQSRSVVASWMAGVAVLVEMAVMVVVVMCHTSTTRLDGSDAVSMSCFSNEALKSVMFHTPLGNSSDRDLAQYSSM